MIEPARTTRSEARAARSSSPATTEVAGPPRALVRGGLVLLLVLGGGRAGASAARAPGLDDAALRTFERAFRSTRDPLGALDRRAAAVRGLAGDGRPAVARALIEAYDELERELEPAAEAHREAVLRDQRANGFEHRAELDGLRGLQDELLAALADLTESKARAAAVERGLEDARLPLSLRLACARLAAGLPPEAAGDLGKELQGALRRVDRKPADALVALETLRALGRAAPVEAALERALTGALSARSARVRLAAARALAAVGANDAVPSLIAVLASERGRGARTVAESLRALTGARLGTAADAWTRWYEREGRAALAARSEGGHGPDEAGGVPAVDTLESGAAARYHTIPIEGRSILFVIDVSRSMEKPLAGGGRLSDKPQRRIDRAREELRSALEGLAEQAASGADPVRFGLVAFARRARYFEDEPLPATEDEVERALEWADGLGLEQGTDTYGALAAAFGLAGRGFEDEDFAPAYDTLFLLSDGVPFAGGGPDSAPAILSAARRWNAGGGLVVNSIGLGDEVPADLMASLAREHGGRFVLETAAGTLDLTRRPNVVLFLVDDLGWRDPGFAGGEFDTPSIDRLTSEGTRFAQAYANAPNCAPSRASLLTGCYPPRHGIYTVLPADRGPASERALVASPSAGELPAGLPTLADTLRAAGYATASVGKWHLGPDPRAHGFDVNVGGTARGHAQSHLSPYSNPALADGAEGEYLTERLTDEAFDFVRAHANRPFFLYLSHYAVHTPLQAPEALREKYAGRVDGERRATYAAMVEAVDASLGRLLDLLDELELDERTLVVFTSDNGGLASVTSMEPLAGQKGTIREGGLRVPLAVRFPGRVRAGAEARPPVMGSDLFPTIAQLCGVPAPPVDGESLLPLLLGEGGLDRRELFWHFPAYLEPYGDDPEFRARPCSAVRRGRHKLVEYFEDGRLELFDLRADPGETRDLARELPEVRDELHALLREWREETGAPVPTEPNPDYGGRRRR